MGRNVYGSGKVPHLHRRGVNPIYGLLMYIWGEIGWQWILSAMAFSTYTLGMLGVCEQKLSTNHCVKRPFVVDLS